MDINNKIAVVITGGFAYISFATVQQLLRNGAKHVAVLDSNHNETNVNVKSMRKEFPGNSFSYFACDIAEGTQFEDCYDKITNTIGYIDILIYNAGLSSNNLRPYEDYDVQVTFNFNTPIHCTIFALNRMSISQMGKGGTILIIGSALALVNPFSHPLYSSTQHGNFILARALKEQKSLNGVRVLYVIPHGTKPPVEEMVTDKFQGFAVTASFVEEDLQSKFANCTFNQTPQEAAVGIIQVLKSDEDEQVWICQNGQRPFALREEDKIDKLLEYCEPNQTIGT